MINSKKPIVFRVQGLLRDQPDEKIAEALEQVLTDELTDLEIGQVEIKADIVPSCYEPDKERVAIVQIRGGLPGFLFPLKENPLASEEIEMNDTDLKIDCHFHKFTQLYKPKENEPVTADIIAITGLDGHAYGSWRGKGRLGRMWLRDFLSKDLPQCRTMIYGYNSKLSRNGVETIFDYGRGLMEEIKQIRTTQELQQRPLIFIAHSFGGIILAHCLVRAIQTMEEDHPAIRSLHQATYGMILFGILHEGLMIENIQQMLVGGKENPRNHLLQQISRKSDILIHQLADFKNLIRDRKVVSFYETSQTKKLELSPESGRWERSGDFITTVGADSALLQLPDHVEEKIPLEGDHSQIVKFNTRKDEGYRYTHARLKQFSKDAPSVVAARFAQMRQKGQPCSTVPFAKDPKFVGRESVISEIKEKHGMIGERHERVALVGLAGVGKTQTAIEYAYRVRESTPDTWVFWIHASDAGRLEQAYRQIATVAEIPAREDPNEDIFQLVYQWLLDPKNGRWLIVLDNADDNRTFFGGSSSERGPLVSFLPEAAHGSILITSRNDLAARNLLTNKENAIQLQPMDEKESLALLRVKIARQSGESKQEKALVRALEYIPLAITQAGCFIANRSPRVTVSRYLRMFRESESIQTNLLQHEDAKDIRRDLSIGHTVIKTWQLSFEQICRDRPEATDLLALMCMFDRQGIPEGLVRANEDELQFEDAVAPLMSYSLVRFENKTRSFNLHRLVQLSVRTWLDINNKLAWWQAKSRAVMAETFPDGEYESWRECQQLLPHAREVMKSIPDGPKEDQLHAASVCLRCGQYLRLRGEYREAEAMHQRALETRQKVLGPGHLDTLASVSNLALVFSEQGKYEEAESMHRQALEASQWGLGAEYPDTAVSISYLANVLSEQGKNEEAEAMHRQALEAHQKVHEPEHPEILKSVNNLAVVLFKQGKYQEAETMHRWVLEVHQKVLDPEHPDILKNVSNLAAVLSAQNKYEEAEAMYRRLLEARQKIFVSEHPDTLRCVNNLAVALSEQGKHEKAEAMHRWVFEARQRVLGPGHPYTLRSATKLANVLFKQGKYEQAAALY